MSIYKSQTFLCGTCTMLSFIWLGYRICVSFTRFKYFIRMVQNTTSNFMIFPFKFDFCSSHFELECT